MPDGITLKRIIDMDEATELNSSDYVLVDSSSGGNRKYNLGEDLNNLKDDFKKICSAERLSPTYIGKYISTNGSIGSTVDTDSPVTNASFNSYVISCNENDVFIVDIIGGSTPRAYAWLDSSKKILFASGTNETVNQELIAISNASYLVINDNSDGEVLKGQPINPRIDLLDSEMKTIIGTGKNLFNKDSATLQDTFLVNESGVLISAATYFADIIPLDSTQTKISVSTTYTYIVFVATATPSNFGASHIGNAIEGFISGQLVSSPAASGVTIPSGARAVIVSTADSKKATLQVEYGNDITGYESYIEGIKGNKALPKSIPLSALEVEIDPDNKENYDTSIYALPYIYRKKVMCNKAVNAGTAYYAGVDSKGTPETMTVKFIWEQAKTNSGTVAVISQKNGLNSVSDITSKSFHLVLTRTHVALNLLDSVTSTEDVISEDLADTMVADGVTEHTLSVSVSGNTVTITVDNETFTGTVQTAGINLSDYIGRYVQFEHYCGGDMDSYTMPMFTYWKVEGSNIWITIEDNFSRPSGLLTRTPQGYEYHVFTNINNGY